jgi:hypothetical protein
LEKIGGRNADVLLGNALMYLIIAAGGVVVSVASRSPTDGVPGPSAAGPHAEARRLPERHGERCGPGLGRDGA